VIDVRAGLMSPHGSLREHRISRGCESGQITFAVSTARARQCASLNEIEEPRFYASAKYFLVKNFVNDTNFSNGTRRLQSYFHRIADARAQHPKLNEMAFERVEIASVPFLNSSATKA